MNLGNKGYGEGQTKSNACVLSTEQKFSFSVEASAQTMTKESSKAGLVDLSKEKSTRAPPPLLLKLMLLSTKLLAFPPRESAAHRSLFFFNRTMQPWWLLDENTTTQLPLATKPSPRTTHSNRLGRHRDNRNRPPKCVYCRDPLGRPGLSPGTTRNHCCVLLGPRKQVQGPRSLAGRDGVTLAYQTCHLCKIYPYGIRILAGKAGRHLALPRQQEREILLWVLHVGLFAGESSQRGRYL
jgi:hypothetical protein